MSLNEVIKNKKPNSNIYKIFDDCIKELPKVYIENAKSKNLPDELGFRRGDCEIFLT